MSRRISSALILALFVCLAAGGARAQAPAGLEAVPTQGLAFGSLLPGVAETVQTGDGARRAEVVLRGEGWVDLSFMLPQAMVSPSGARIPLRFGARDGALLRNSSSGTVPLNPLETSRIKLNANQGAMRILLGGTALPAQDQPAGRYTATIVIVASPPGT
ncbi:MAG TPA: hypothetical protein VGV85_01270 [Longimicrobiaceae bacterium]|nr:hypothetical protein [Longimicrobiaceae bacterium]